LRGRNACARWFGTAVRKRAWGRCGVRRRQGNEMELRTGNQNCLNYLTFIRNHVSLTTEACRHNGSSVLPQTDIVQSLCSAMR
jgi:hypothetical protein